MPPLPVFKFLSSSGSLPLAPLDMESHKHKSLIQEGAQGNRLEAEDFPDEFQCCICLDLLYKPVVLACGHMSCFWCVFNAMSYLHESHCPICRHPYNHFPSICQLLHFLLLKLYPVAYKMRERQVGEEEKKIGHFSPQFDYLLFGSRTCKELHIMDNHQQSLTHSQTKLCRGTNSGEGESSLIKTSSEVTIHHGDNVPIIPTTASESSEATENTISQQSDLLRTGCEYGTDKQVAAADLPCAACKKLLFRPVVLNCGHVYCESCVTTIENSPRCQVCQSLHPNGLPSVCLILHHFLEEHFPGIYAERQAALSTQTDGSTQAQPRAARSSGAPINFYSWWLGNGPKVHVGVGCDSCGMSPIIGERYKCRDCTEEIGFDLCEGCYKNPTQTPGRFNQRHKPEHKFENLQPPTLNDIFMRHAEQSDDDSLNSSVYEGDVSHVPTSSDDVLPEDGFDEA